MNQFKHSISKTLLLAQFVGASGLAFAAPSAFSPKDATTGQLPLVAKEASRMAVQQQFRIVTGKIVDTKGEPIIGANVVVKGTTNGTITDFDGNFSIEAPSNAVLQVSYIGYMPQDVPVGNRSALQIVIKEDTQNLD